MSESLQADILARLEQGPHARCLAFHRSEEALRWLSRQEFHQKAVGVAHYLRWNGLMRGDVCVIVLPSGETSALMLVATLLLGAIPLLVAPPTLAGGNQELDATLRSTLRRTRARVAVCAPSLEPDLARLQRSVPAVRFVVIPSGWRVDLAAAALTPVLPQTGDVAAMQLTSGTTAAPRICVWDHTAILAALSGMAAAMALSRDDVCLNWTPLYHDMGFVNNFLLCLARGVPLVLLSPHEFIRRPALWLRQLSDTGATITWSPNFGFAITSNKATDGELVGVRLDGVRAFWNAAERIHLETIETFYRRFAPFGVRRQALKTNYGCAENVGGATFSALDALPRHERVDRRLLDERGIARKVTSAEHDGGTVQIVSAGRPNPGLTVCILSTRGRMRPDGMVGEICLDTPSRMLGYHRNARETRRAFRGGPLHTGDLGYVRDGELFWVGRLRERITVHAKKIDPSAFEAVLASTPGLRQGCFAAFGVPDERTGTERVIVVSEVQLLLAGRLERIAATICRRCFVQLGITPNDVVLVHPGTLPKTSSGKRRHRYFRKLYLAGVLEPARLTDERIAASAPAPRPSPEAG